MRGFFYGYRYDQTRTHHPVLMNNVVELPMWQGIQDEDVIEMCQECYSDTFKLLADGRPVCAECEMLVTNLKIVKTD